jgi:glycine betaine/proline transport system ATP-binding protein
LARAFATDADILLMDEPFSALDPLIRTKLQDELLALQKEVKKTIIFVSHDLDEALKLGNQIAILEGGRIIQAGAPEDIVLRPANDYVREFVQHMNPLNVLRGRTFMTSLERLQPRDGGVVLDAYRPVLLQSAGAVAGSTVVDCEATMKTVIQLRQATGMPVLITQGGQIIGMCGEDEILHALASDGWQTVQAEAAD